MGAVLEMKTQRLFVLLALGLAACGNDRAINDFSGAPQAMFSGLQAKLKPTGATANLDDPAVKAGILNFRNGLQKDGQPILLASNAKLKYGNLLAPFGGSNGVVTWSSTSYQTISLRDGVMVATRGFGPDLMSSVAPGIATIAAGHGTTQRRYSYLDGGDQAQTLSYTCTLAQAGSESIEVLAKVYAARQVTETCTGPAGGFTNAYWFDHGLNLRQSKQFLAPGLDDMFMQRVID